jgi:hypothetical protein
VRESEEPISEQLNTMISKSTVQHSRALPTLHHRPLLSSIQTHQLDSRSGNPAKTNAHVTRSLLF